LCKIAQAWANTIASKGSMQHSTSGYGENIFWASSDVKDAKAAIEKWYSEIKDFDWKNLDWQKGTGITYFNLLDLFPRYEPLALNILQNVLICRPLHPSDLERINRAGNSKS